MYYFACGYFVAGCFNFESFIVEGRSSVFDMYFGDDEEYACGFEVLVCDFVCAEQFSSANLEPDRVDAVVDNASLIGFGVSWHNCCFERINSNFFWKIHHCGILIFDPALFNLF